MRQGVDPLDRALDGTVSPINRLYGYCGSRYLQPTAAFDDGVRTHLSFPSRAEIPAVYVQNDDKSESLVNFTVTPDGLTVHRIARRFVIAEVPVAVTAGPALLARYGRIDRDPHPLPRAVRDLTRTLMSWDKRPG